MAKCQFPEFLGLVSGTLSKKTITTPKGKQTTRLVAKVCNGKQRVYLQHCRQRTTKVQPQEIERRSIFAQRAALVAQLLSNNKKLSKKQAWQIAKDTIH